MEHEIAVAPGDARVIEVPMHDGTRVRLRPVTDDYDPTDRASAYAHVRACQARGEIATGLLFVDEKSGQEMVEGLKLPPEPLHGLAYETLCPGSAALDALMDRYR